MRYHYESALAVWLPVGNSNRMRTALYQEIRIKLPRLIGLFFGSHGTASRIGKFELERLHYRTDRIEHATTRRASKVQSDNFARRLVNNDRAGITRAGVTATKDLIEKPDLAYTVILDDSAKVDILDRGLSVAARSTTLYHRHSANGRNRRECGLGLQDGEVEILKTLLNDLCECCINLVDKCPARLERHEIRKCGDFVIWE
jgi:hypothetical protein